jgi:hypothetical protein
VSSPARWESWAPPLAPPAEGGLSRDDAAAIAAAWWDDDPHLAAALMWEAYAATLPPALAVAQVSTGAQSVSYGRATPGGDLGAAMSRAAWHRSMADTSGSVPLEVVPPPGRPRPVGLAWEVASLDADAGY